MDGSSSHDTHSRTDLLLLYFAAYIFSAAYFQLRSDTPPWIDGSPIEYFTGALLWMSSLISLLMAEIHLGESRRSWFWLAASAGLAVLAIDELFSLHEKSVELVGDDDHIKVLQWIFAGGVIYYMNRFELSSYRSKIASVRWGTIFFNGLEAAGTSKYSRIKSK